MLKERETDRYVMKQDHLRVIKCLLDSGASTLSQDSIGATAMHYACKSGDMDVLNLLMSVSKRKYVLVDKSGQTPLHWAAEHGRADVVKSMILQLSVDSMPRKAGSQTEHFFGNLVKLALPRVKDKRGWLPLHVAAAAGESDCVDALLERVDVDPATTDRRGRSPLILADQNDHLACRASLRTAMAARPDSLEEDTVIQDETLRSSSTLVVSGMLVTISLFVLIAVNWW